MAEEIQVTDKTEKYQQRIIITLIIAIVIITYFYIKQIGIPFSGTELLLIMTLGIGGTLYFKKQSEKPKLPPTHQIINEVANTEYKTNGTKAILDWTNTWTEQVSDTIMNIYFVGNNKVRQYVAGEGIRGAKTIDLDTYNHQQEEKLYAREFMKEKRIEEKRVKLLEEKGLEPTK